MKYKTCGFRCCILIISIAMVGGCMMNEMGEPDGRPVSTASIYNLSHDEISNLVAEAGNGDNLASFRLYQYYLLSNYNLFEAIEWLKKSAQDGNSVAQYALAVFYLDFPELENIDEGNYWLRQSASSGYEPAKEKLEKLEQGFDQEM